MTAAYQSLLSFSLGKGTPTFTRGRERRGSSDSSSSGMTTHESIYEARPVSSREISPSEPYGSTTTGAGGVGGMSLAENNVGVAVSSVDRGSGRLSTIVEQKGSGGGCCGILAQQQQLGSDSETVQMKPEDGCCIEECGHSILSDPYDMAEEDITIEDVSRYYGSPTAPLSPSVPPPPELPPIPHGATSTIGGRIVGSASRPWRPPVSGYRTFGSMNSHPFHHAPIAEVVDGRRRVSDDGYSDTVPLLGNGRDGRSYLERWGVWSILSSVGCCFGCFGPRESIEE